MRKIHEEWGLWQRLTCTYRDFEENQSQVSIQSANSSNFSRFEDSEEPRLKYDRLSSDIKKIIERGDSAEAVTVHDKFIVVGKLLKGDATKNRILWF